MQRLSSIVFGCVVLATANIAAALQCQTGSLASYLALDGTGCDIGAMHFFDFSLLQGPNGASTFSTLTLSPVIQGDQVGLDFNVNAQASDGDFFEQLIGYRVLGVGVSLIGTSVAINGSTTTGDAAVTAVENTCLGGFFAAANGVAGCTGSPLDLAVVNIFGSADPPATASFAPIQALAAVTDIGIDSGTDGSSTLTSASTRFRFVPAAGTVPEPGALLLLLGALAAFRLTRPLRTTECSSLRTA